ncbi:MAG: efflux transporter outer membrane subunit [Arcobacteraceae bacterium]
MKKQIIFSTALAIFLTACSSSSLQVNSHYELPKNLENAAFLKVDKFWWQHFEEEDLNSLVNQMLDNNSDMLMALQKIEQAKLYLDNANASFFPSIDASVNSSSNKKREKGESYTSSKSTSATISMNYELDLWGKVRASHNIAQAALNMTQYDFETIQLSLVATLVETYFQYTATCEKIKLTRYTIQNEEKVLTIMKKKHELGTINALDLGRQKSSLLTYESTLTALELQKKSLHSSLALLVGKSSQELHIEEPSFEKIIIPKVSENLSSTLLLNRPDVARAKEQIKSNNASVHAAYASLFPSFNLTAQAGQASASLLSLNHPTTTLGLGLGLNLNLFDRDILKNQVKIEQSKTYESVENYKKTVLTALKEVEDALNSSHSNKIQNELKEAILKEENKTLSLSQLQYDYGVIDFSLLMDAKKANTQAKESLINQKLLYLYSLVTLQKALSGSWVEEEEKER